MNYKILLKRKTDEKVITIFEVDSLLKQFIQDIKRYSFWVLQGRILKWKLDEFEIFQVLDINYDFYDRKRWYMIYSEVTDSNYGTYIESFSASDMYDGFIPEEHDITRNILMDYYISNLSPTNQKPRIKKVIYDKNLQALLFDEEPYSLKGTSIYQQIAKIFFESWEIEVKLWLFCEDIEIRFHHLELSETKIRAHISYFNKQIDRKFWIWDLIRVWDKALNNSFPVVLKDLESK